MKDIEVFENFEDFDDDDDFDDDIKIITDGSLMAEQLMAGGGDEDTWGQVEQADEDNNSPKADKDEDIWSQYESPMADGDEDAWDQYEAADEGEWEEVCLASLPVYLSICHARVSRLSTTAHSTSSYRLLVSGQVVGGS